MHSLLFLFDFIFPTLIVFAVWQSRSISFSVLVFLALASVVYNTFGVMTPSFGGPIIGGTRCFPTLMTVLGLMLYRSTYPHDHDCGRPIFITVLLITLVNLPSIMLATFMQVPQSQSVDWQWAALIAGYSSLVNPLFAYLLVTTEDSHAL